MNTPTIIKYAILHALGAALYVALIASFLYYVPQQMGPVKSVFVPIVMLSLFVLSAAIMGLLFFARPVIWYLQGAKSAALRLVGYTVGIFAVITILFLGVLLAIR